MNITNKYSLAAVIGGILILFLVTSCGANVDTDMTIDANFRGTRKMVCTLSSSDMEEFITGGKEALAQSVETYLPEELEYSMSEEEDGIVAEFVLSFDSLDDYRKKTSAILAWQDNDRQPEILFENPDSLFKKGIFLKENFTSGDLLTWLADGLLEDGIVSHETQSDFFEPGSTVLSFQDEEYSSSAASFHIDEIEKHCMDAVSIKTYLGEDGTISRTISYTMGADSFDQLKGKLGPFMETLVPEGGAFDFDTGERRWTISFEAKSSQELEEYTNQALHTDDTQFEYVSKENPAKPASQQVSITQNHNASYFCDYTGYESPVKHSFYLEQGYSLADHTEAGATAYEEDGYVVVSTAAETPDVYQIHLDRVIPLDLIRVETILSVTGGMKREIRFYLSPQNAETAGESIETLLSAGTGGEIQFRSEVTEQSCQYIVTLEGRDAETLNDLMTTYLGNPGQEEYVSVRALTGGKLDTGSRMSSAYFIDEHLSFQSLLGDIPSKGGIEYVITYPALVSPAKGDKTASEKGLDSNQILLVSSGTSIGVSSAASGVSVFGVILVMLLILCALAFLLLVLVNLKHIIAFFRQKKAMHQVFARNRKEAVLPGPISETELPAGTDNIQLPDNPVFLSDQPDLVPENVRQEEGRDTLPPSDSTKEEGELI